MPVEIRELIIRARVDPNDERPGRPSRRDAGGDAEREQELLRAAVRETLQVLEDKRER